MKPLKVTQAAILVASIIQSAYAWGGLGHETVAFIASNFVDQTTQDLFQNILGDNSPEYMAKVATWADSYRYTKAGKFSEPFHFIDSNDNPPDSCSVAFNRDCGTKGCVVAAVQNYTSRVMDTSLSQSERDMAAKFIIHFIGDIHQPLHDENLDKGGNGIKVTFAGKPTNLHAVWDTSVPEKLVGGFSLEDAQKWASDLTQAISSGSYSSQAKSWLNGMSLDDSISSTMIWATEANKFVCSTVMPDGPDALEGQELDGDYYNAAVPVVQLQIAKAGYRLAAWLKLIASSLQSAEL